VNELSTSSIEAKYGDKVLTVEPYGIETVENIDRHGSAKGQFPLWLGSNLTIADYALGFLPISLGMSWGFTIASILVGNLLGALVLALCAAMGPSYGEPQLMIGRFSFGRVGGYLPAVLNYMSTIGWFTVNNILGAFGLKVLFPSLSFWQGAVILVIIQSLLAIYGHNLIHLYERIMAVVLGIMFIIITAIAISHHTTLAAYHATTHAPWAMFGIMVAAAFSYIGSWGPYASDYSRYLPKKTTRSSIIGASFWGAFIASVWLELVGAAVAVLAGAHPGNPISAIHTVAGAFGTASVIAVILGGTAADALNLYSNSLSAGAMGLKLPRWLLALSASVLGLILSLLGSGSFESNYDSFLLLLGYWMTPWVGVLFADFYIQKAYKRLGSDKRNLTSIQAPGLVSFLVGIAVSTLFMNSGLYEGPIAKALNGVDLAFYVGFLVSFVLYLAWNKPTKSAKRADAQA
jgi:nucleobase:cation symporter-1, NCS1 family